MKDMLCFPQIGIRCPYPIQDLDELTITNAYNNHGKATITGILRYEDRDKCIETATSEDPLDIYELTNTGEAIHIFSGVVTSLEVHCQAQIYYVVLEAMTRTYLMDNKLKRRSFQDKTASYKNVIDQVVTDYPDGAYIQIPDDRPTESLLVQYDETDWAFLQRLATHFNTVLIADTLGPSPRFWLGIHKTKKEFKSEPNYVTDFLADRYRYMIAHGFDLSPGHFMKYEVKSSDFLRLGDKVTYMGGDCLVVEAEARFTKDRLTYKYVLGREHGSLETVQHNQHLNGLAIMGKVLDRQDSSIKAHLTIDEKQDVNKACWIPYAAQTNNLFYCMPEVGENIYLYFANAIENEAIAVSSVRSNGGKIPRTSDPQTKYMSIPSGQGFKLGPTDLEFFGHKPGLFISMDKEKGLTIQSPDDLVLYSQGKFSLEAKKKVTFQAQKGTTLVGAGHKGEKSQIYLEGGASGNAHIFTKGMLIRIQPLLSANWDNPSRWRESNLYL